MKELTPYVNVSVDKKDTTEVNDFVVRVAVMLPKGCRTTVTGDEEITDQTKAYRPITISYEGGSDEYELFSTEIKITPQKVGLMERGVNVKVVASSTCEDLALREPSTEGAISDYFDNEI